MNQEFEVSIGGRLVAIVNAKDSFQVSANINVKARPPLPSVPLLKLDQMGIAR